MFFVGLSIVVIALIAMAAIYVRILIEERAYCRGHYYADEFDKRLDQMRGGINLCGLLLFVGVIVIAFNLVAD